MGHTKLDLRGELGRLYAATSSPEMVFVPEMQFIAFDGLGDSSTSPRFEAATNALFHVAYAARSLVRAGPTGLDYAVMPLEGLWSGPGGESLDAVDRDSWEWTLMIMQPPQATGRVFQAALETAAEQSRGEAVTVDVTLRTLGEGRAAQVLHRGPYSGEGPSVRTLHDFIAAHDARPWSRHHEIYLTDPRLLPPERWQTILRQPVHGRDGT
ncbi:MAG: hypothetical protein JWQ91_510 [Aeromicrobium sp.]|jgi:hypothetical protein|uniref:GyrI-like domain-containing protein n=1 Tax=Aeromicrobium sp. TaxID=1871063 RepID=UPI002638616D|nr:GyrI-like domain-containing protein [Aeromicrobium sp.]MCW2823593.1 hypothetical protein [Aeromicrobium sp.]